MIELSDNPQKTTDDILNELQKIFIENLEDINPNFKIKTNDKISDYGVNSIQFIQILVNIEKTFNIEFQDDDLDLGKFETVSSLVQYLELVINKN